MLYLFILDHDHKFGASVLPVHFLTEQRKPGERNPAHSSRRSGPEHPATLGPARDPVLHPHR